MGSKYSEHDKKIIEGMRRRKIIEQLKNKPIKTKTRRQRILESLKKESREPSNPPARVVQEPNVLSTQDVIKDMKEQGKLYPKPYDITKIKEGYTDMEPVTKELRKTQKKFDLLLRAEKSISLRLYLGTKNRLSSYLFGTEKKSIEDLFEIQLKNIEELINKVEPILDTSEKVSNNFKKARDTESAEARVKYEKREQLEAEIPRMQQELVKEREIFQQLPYDSDKYLGQQLKIRDLERELRKSRVDFKIVSDSFIYKDGPQEIHFGGVEEWVDASIGMGRVIINHAKEISNTLNHAYPAIATADNIWKAIGETEESLRGLEHHTEEIYKTLSGGVSKMKEIANTKSSMYTFIEDKGRNIKFLLGGIRKTSEPQKAQNLLDELNEIRGK